MANVRVDMLNLRDADNTVLAATHGRGMFTTKWELGNTSSRNDISLIDNLRVYPNPTDGEFNIETELSREATLSIIDTQGRLIHTEKVQAGPFLKRLDFSNEPEGIYIIKIDEGDNRIIKKILVK